jgi:hypothetical protein
MNEVGKSQYNRGIGYPRQQFTSTFPEYGRRSRMWAILALVVLVLAICRTMLATPSPVGAARSAQPSPPGHVPEQLLVQPKAHVSEAEFQGLVRSHGAMEVGAIHQINVRVLHVPEERLSTVLSALRHNPNIEFAEPDLLVEPALVPNDTYYSLEWHLPKIEAASAWDTTVGTSNIIIAIIDSGVDGNHPDLAPQLVPGWNFYDNNADTSDVTGHGTGVAGNACAAGNNGIGVASPAWNCKIMPIRVADTNGYASTSMIAQGVIYAADNGAKVANASFQITSTATLTNAAAYFQTKGGIITVAAGNSGIFSPSPDDPYLITVSATDANDAVASFSNTGNNIDISAPGVNIVTTVRGGGYGYATGTSASAPLVAGVAALVLSVNPNLSAVQLRSLLEQTADDLGPAGWDPGYGYGRLNAYKAVLAAAAGIATNTPPVATIVSPVEGGVLSNLVTVSVSATDSVAVTVIACYLNGVCICTNSSVPATFSWDTTAYTNGSYNLQALAVDASGNSATSTIVTVTVQNPVPDTTPPSVQILSPAPGATLSGLNSVNVSSSDNVAVTKVEWYLDGALTGSSASSTPAFSWNTISTPNGSHSLLAKAYDAAGNIGTSATVNVTVQNTTTKAIPPTVKINSPANSSTITQKTTKVYAVTSDTVGVVRADLIVDGAFYTSLTISPAASTWNPVFNWNTSKLARGSHTLQSAAYDSAGNTNCSTVVTVYK